MGLLGSLFYKLGQFNSKHPYLVILLSLAVTAGFCVGFIWLKVSTDPQHLWVNPDSRSNKEQNYFNDNFGKFFRVEEIYFISKTDPENTDTFQKKYLEEVWEVQAKIESSQILYDNSLYTVDNYCYKPINGKGCFISSPMDYWKMNLTKMLEDPDIKYTAQCIKQTAGEQITCSDRNEIPIIRNVVFGGVTCLEGTSGPCEECKIAANALVVTFLMNNNDDTLDMGVKSWEKDIFEKRVKEFNDDDSKLLKAVYYSERSVPDELQKEDSQNFIYVVISYLCMFLYISIAIGYFPSHIHSRFTLGFAGISVVIMSVCISIGLTSMLGIELSMISIEVVPFLILAIGVDNMFIISIGEINMREKAYRENWEEGHDKVVGAALKENGSTITAAAFSEFAAFIVGATTDIPALSNFCVTAAIAVLADYLLQITAFCAVLELDYRRRSQNRIDCFPCVSLEEEVPEPKRNITKWVVKNYYVPVIFHPISKFFMLVTFVGIMLLSFVSYNKLNLGLTEQVTAVKNSDLYDYFNALDNYGEAGPIAYLVLKNVNYSNPYNLQVIDEIADTLSQMNKTVQPPVYNWVKGVNAFVNTQEDDCKHRGISSFDFNTQVREYLKVSIESVCCKKYGVCGEQYETDIIFDESGNIKTSRLRFQHRALKSQSDYIDSLRDTRYAIDKLGKKLVPMLDKSTKFQTSLKANVDWTDSSDSFQNNDRLAFGYSLFYVYYDQYENIRGLAIENLLLAFGAILLAVEILTNLYAAFIVTLMVAATSWGLIGFCYVWNEISSGYGTEINAVSVVNLVMCCGLAVEFSVHIMTSFLKAKGKRTARAKKAVIEMGSTVFTGIAFTKFIGVVVLGFAPSEVFTLYYFRMYFCIILLGVFHGLAFQPVLLSYIGPPEKKNRSEEKSTKLKTSK